MADGAETISGGGGDNLRRRQRNSLAGSRKTFSFVSNPYGIRIKQCCASCGWKQLTGSLVTRKCKRWGKRVRPKYYCQSWQMRKELAELKIKN